MSLYLGVKQAQSFDTVHESCKVAEMTSKSVLNLDHINRYERHHIILPRESLEVTIGPPSAGIYSLALMFCCTSLLLLYHWL